VKTAPPESLTPEQKQKLWLWHFTRWPLHYGQCANCIDDSGPCKIDRAQQPSGNIIHRCEHSRSRSRFLKDQVEEILLWWKGEGRKKADWLATIQVHIRKVMIARGYQPYEEKISKVNPRGKAPFESGGRPMTKVDEVAGQMNLLEGG
jgi:hypothetical protein